MGKGLSDLIASAAGRLDCGLVLENTRIVNVFTHEVYAGDIAIADGRIAGIGAGAEYKYKGAEHVDLGGRYVVPGLIDGHMHIESTMVLPSEFSRAVLSRGTTAVVADPHEIANVCGLEGISFMLGEGSLSPLDIFIMLPSCIPATPQDSSGARLDAGELAKLAGHAGVLGLGEMMDYRGVVEGRRDIVDKLDLFCGRMVDGHAPGLTGLELNAYAAAGIRTEHECSTVEEMLGKLRLGFYVLIREGSAARDLKTLIAGVTPENMRRCVFCTDDRHLDDIVEFGHIDNNIRLAIKCGLDPINAVIMATLNAAECYGLRERGAIAPGYIADLVVLDDLETFAISSVYKSGRLIDIKKGRPAGEDRPAGADKGDSDHTPAEGCKAAEERVPPTLLNTIRIAPVIHKDLEIRLSGPKVNIIGLTPGSLLTRKLAREVTFEDGAFVCRKDSDPVKLAVIERHTASGRVGLGLLDGIGIRGGAIASTVSHDSHNLIVAGDNDQDMLAAIGELSARGGGITVCSSGEVVRTLALPAAGLMSLKSYEEVELELGEMLKAARRLGVPEGIEPFMALSFLALSVIPEIRLTDRGIFDVVQGSFIEICTEK